MKPEKRSTHKEIQRFSAVVPETVIKLSDESFWVGLRTNSGSVEGKLYLPSEPNGTIVIFEPGFPGDGSTRLDNLWAPKLVDDGYAIFAARHNGTIINGDYSNTYLNCPEKQKKAEKDNQQILGEKDDPTIADWIKEPLVALEVFASSYQEVCLSGHSFGGLATLSSVIDFTKENPQLAGRIKRFVSLAGTFGRFRGDQNSPMKGWGQEIDTDTVRAKVRIGDKEGNLKILRDSYVKIHEQSHLFPSNMDFIFITPWGNTSDSTDELVSPLEDLDMLLTLKKGYLILDQTQRADVPNGKLAHDMDNLKPETFAKFLNRNWRPQNQISFLF